MFRNCLKKAEESEENSQENAQENAPEKEEIIEESEKLDAPLGQFPAIWSEEGKYLATVLGDALVKGLTQVSQDRPNDPVEYLANFLKTYKDEENSTDSTIEAIIIQNAKNNDDYVGPTAPLSSPNRAPLSSPNNENEPENGPESSELLSEIEERKLSAQMDSESENDENMIHNIDEMDDPDPEIEGGDADGGQSGTRDDRGQSVLHFAAARPGGSSTILAFLQNPSVNLAWRDERLRTARDIAKGLEKFDNVKTIDNWIVSLAVAGDKESLEQLLLDGYDHLTEIEDSNNNHIIEMAEKAGKREMAIFLRSIPDFNERLIKTHKAVRNGDMETCKNLLMRDHRLAIALSPWGRTCLHVAVLQQEFHIVRFICEHFQEALKRGDNIERTPLHYAMGVEKVEKMTRVLVRNGAKRVVKDLRGRQPSYYFINREEIALLQREEQELKADN